jgi:CheY-like chemotaxis protein
MRVLIVDDAVDVAHMMAIIVKRHGHESVVAHDGFQALDRAREAAPGLVLMDIQMPGMDGYETTRRMRKELGLAETPIFAVTAFETDPQQERAAGMNGHFRKPLKFDQLSELLKQLN